MSLKRFIEAILQDAEQEAKAILSDVSAQKSQMLSKEESALNIKAQEQINKAKEEIDLSMRGHIAQRQLSLRRDLQLRRQAMQLAMLADVTSALESFAQGTGYADWLFAAAQKAAKACQGATVVIGVAPKDTALAQSLCSQFEGGATVQQEAISIGGIKIFIPEKRQTLDLTLDTALETARTALASKLSSV